MELAPYGLHLYYLNYFIGNIVLLYIYTPSSLGARAYIPSSLHENKV